MVYYTEAAVMNEGLHNGNKMSGLRFNAIHPVERHGYICCDCGTEFDEPEVQEDC